MLKKRRLMLVPLVFSAILVFVVFIPVLPSGQFTLCHASDCVNVVQYDSISYDYGGWGAIGNTDGYYSVQSWMCFCPAEAPGQYVPCCVPPYADMIWPAVALLFAADVASVIAVMGWIPKGG